MTAASNETGTLEHLNPNTLELDANVRTEASVTKQFIASIAANGVLVPITAIRTQDGTVRVRTGQRRTLAAREAGLDTIPVYVIGAGWEDNTERVVEQITENDHRAVLPVTDRVFGIQQLLDAGLSVTKTAKRLARPASYVKDAKAVAGSQQAIDVLGDGQVSLTEAAVIAEFDAADLITESALDRLLRAAGTSRFEHVAAELRAAAAEAEQLARAERGYVDAGYTVLTQLPASFDPECVPLHSLQHADGPDASVADVTTPAHWAVLLNEDSVITDKVTGEIVDENDVDWNTEGQPDAQPEEGLRHADSVLETAGFVPEYFCIDYTAAGLVPNERYVRLGGRTRFPGVELDDAGDAGDEAMEQLAGESPAETEKRERRKVLALNRLGDAALNVRRRFVTTLLARKTAPKGAALFVAACLVEDGYLLTNYKADEITVELLGAKPSSGYGDEQTGGVGELLAGASDTRAQVITLGLVLGALEGRTPKDAWRSAEAENTAIANGWRRASLGARGYLEFLVANGYTLAPVEEIITGDTTADEVYAQHLADK